MRRILFTVLLLASVAHAQTNVNTTPQSTRQRAFTAVNIPGTFIVRNIGQTCHFVTYQSTTTFGGLIRIEASNDGTNWFTISYDGLGGLLANQIDTVFALGFFPLVRVNLVRYVGAGTVTVDYVGTSSCVQPEGNSVNSSQRYVRPVFSAAAADTTQSRTVFPLFGNSHGIILLSHNGLPGAGCTFVVAGDVQTGGNTILTRSLAAAGGQYIFPIPATIADVLSITFNACGATASTFNLTYILQPVTAGLRVAGNSSAVWPNDLSMESEFSCSQSAAISFTAGGAGSTEIIPLVLERIIRICHISFSGTVATNVKIVQGTGANCVTGPVDRTGPYQNVTSLALDFGSDGALRTTLTGQAVCLNVSGAVTIGGVVTFAQF